MTDIRKHLPLVRAETAITRENFERLFKKTSEKVTFTFEGWDGKSYDGESRTARVYRTTIPGFGEKRYVKVGKAVHEIWEDRLVLEKATGKYHPTTAWVTDVLRSGESE